MRSKVDLVLEEVEGETAHVPGAPRPERRTGDNGLPALSFVLPDTDGGAYVLTVSVRLNAQGNPQRIARVYGPDGAQVETSERLRGDATPEIVAVMLENRLRPELA